MADGYCVIVCHSEGLCRYRNVIAGDFQRLYKSPTNLPNNAKQIHSSWILVYSSPAMKILLQIRRKRLKILALKLLGQLKNEIVRTGSKLAQPTFCIRFTVSTVICFQSRTGSVISPSFETCCRFSSKIKNAFSLIIISLSKILCVKYLVIHITLIHNRMILAVRAVDSFVYTMTSA